MSSDVAADFDIVAVGCDMCLAFDSTNEAKADSLPILTLAYLHFRYVIIFGLRRSNNRPGFSWVTMLHNQKELFTEHWNQLLVSSSKRSSSDVKIFRSSQLSYFQVQKAVPHAQHYFDTLQL